MTPKISLIGRPNVGKSTLFNRLIRSKRAITHDRPGVTRDRMEGTVRRGERTFTIIDTGGITLDEHHAVMEGPDELRGFETEILRQTKEAIQESVALVLVVDGRAGLLPFDEALADYCRKSGKPLLLAVNKVDGLEREDELTAEFHALGLEMVAISSEHGHNIRYFEGLLFEMLPEQDELETPEALRAAEEAEEKRRQKRLAAEREEGAEADGQEDIPEGMIVADFDDLDSEAEDEEKEEPVVRPQDTPTGLKLAMLGKPNAGKSSLINAIMGQDRQIVSDIAGTTRDSVDLMYQLGDQRYMFVDTAGIRKRSRIIDTVERYSVNSSIKSSTKAHVTLLVVDAQEGLTLQDKRLISLLDERKTPFIVLINKMDLVTQALRKKVEEQYKEALSMCSHVPVLYVSAKKRSNLKKILPIAEQVWEECQVRVPTGQLNRAMDEVITRHQPPVVKRVRPKFFYLTQAETNPPTFVFFVNDHERIKESYARYLEKSLRKLFGIKYAPMRVRFRSSHTKRVKKKR